MKTKDQFYQELEQLAKVAEAMSIWRPTSVEQEPQTRLTQWRVYEVTHDNLTTIHFIGHTGYEGRVSSAVQTYDPTTKRGVTKSGRVYELVSNPGHNKDAMYVFNVWCSRFPEVATFIDITSEYE